MRVPATYAMYVSGVRYAKQEDEKEKKEGGNISWHLSPTLSQFFPPPHSQTQLWTQRL